MKKFSVLCMALLLVFALAGCALDHMTPSEIYSAMDGLVQQLGQSQITDGADLIGSRCLNGDGFTGGYVSDCSGNTGRDVVFGGASVERRCIRISGEIKTESGSAQIRIRVNDQVTVLDCDPDGRFQTVLSTDSGGSYIMVDYDQFVGTVELDSAYVQSCDDRS